jgi:hypothetical protein
LPVTTIWRVIKTLFGGKKMSDSWWVRFRNWFTSIILPKAVAVLAETIRQQAEKVPGLTALIGLIQPIIQDAYDKAVREGDLKMQAILLAILSKLFQVTLVAPGIEVLDPADAETMIASMAAEAMQDPDEVFAPYWDEENGRIVVPGDQTV